LSGIPFFTYDHFLASFTAASQASAPELYGKNLSYPNNLQAYSAVGPRTFVFKYLVV
jgi:hypothetical protein